MAQARRHMQAMASPPPKPRPTGIAEQLEPLVRRVLAPNPSPFTYTGTQSYIVGLGDGCAVIDPGPDEPAHIDALETAIGGEHVCAIMCTHTHRDHSPAARALAKRTGAPIVGCAPLAFDTAGPRADEGFDPDYEANRVLADGEAMTGPGWTLRAVATARPHLQPPLLRARGKRRAFHRRPRDGLVDQRGGPARRQHDRLHEEPRHALCA